MFAILWKRVTKPCEPLGVNVFENNIKSVPTVAALTICLTTVPRGTGVIRLSNALHIRVERMWVRLNGVTFVTRLRSFGLAPPPLRRWTVIKCFPANLLGGERGMG